MSYFKKHFVTQVRNFVFTYKKSIKGKCHTTDSNSNSNITEIEKQLQRTSLV